jgi:hypothetical protein
MRDDEEESPETDGPGGDQEGSSLADGFFGFGSGSARSSDPPSGDGGEESDDDNGDDDDDWIVGGGSPRDCPINTCCSPPTPVS